MQKLKIPTTLKEQTSVVGPNLKLLASEKQEKQQVYEQTQRTAHAMLDQQIMRVKQQVSELDYENKQMQEALRGFHVQRTPISKDPLAKKLVYDQALSKRTVLQQKVDNLNATLQRETSEMDKPDTYVQQLLQKTKMLETQLDETNLRLTETTGATECLSNVRDKLAHEQIRFEKEIELTRIESDILLADHHDIKQYVSESIEAKQICTFQLVEEEQRVSSLRSQWQEKRQELQAERDRQQRLDPAESSQSDSDSAERRDAELRVSIFKKFDELHIDGLNSFVDRVRRQPRNTDELNGQLAQNSAALKQLQQQQTALKTQIGEVRYQMSCLQNEKAVEQTKNELKNQQLAFGGQQVRYQQTAMLQADLVKAVGHIGEQLSIFKVDGTEFGQKTNADQQLRLTQQKIAVLMELIGDQPGSQQEQKNDDDLFEEATPLAQNVKIKLESKVVKEINEIDFQKVQDDLRKQRTEQKKKANDFLAAQQEKLY